MQLPLQFQQAATEPDQLLIIEFYPQLGAIRGPAKPGNDQVATQLDRTLQEEFRGFPPLGQPGDRLHGTPSVPGDEGLEEAGHGFLLGEAQRL